MARLDASVPLTGSKLSHILRGNPEFIEHLSLCLDRDMRLIHNWKHLASTLEVEVDVIKRLEQYGDFSPTFRLFDFLESWKPDLTIKELKETMLEIGRNDLLNLLTTEVVCIDSERVVDVITKPSEAPSPRAGILDELALALDGRSLVLSNWYTLAIKLGVQRITCWTFERRSTENPTSKLFQYLATSCPQLTLNSLKEALDSIDRRDLMNFLKNKNLGDDVLLKDVITPGSELLEKISQELNRDDNIGVKNYVHLARKWEVPAEILRQFADVQQCRKSPTKEVLEWVAARFPETTLSDIAQALEKIQRNDAIQIISRHFPNTIDSVLKELGCSFQGSLNVPDPTRAMISTSRRRERRGSPPKQVAEVQEQSGHFGSLPDRTNLVGRSDICGNIISALSSKKAVEIVAPPGYGKTSVVIEVAHKMMEVKKAIAYVNPRDVTCVEDLESKIIEALGFGPGENTMTEIFRRLSSLQKNSVLLIIENIDNLLHLEDQVSNDKCYQDLKSTNYNTKVCGKYMKDDFLTFFKDLGQRPNIQLLLTSRIIYDFNVYFPVELIDLEPLNEKDSASMFEKCDDGLEEDLIKDLVRVCGGIPLVICIVISILKRENPHEAARRLSTTSPSCLARELDADFLANEDRIYNCLQVCFDRLSHENQKILVIFSTFPCSFTRKQFQTVFELSVEGDLQTCLNCLKQSSLLRFDRRRNFSLDPFIKDFLSLKPGHTEAKSTFICHYSTLVVTLYKTFLSKDCKSAIVQYILEKNNIREAMAWCGDDHPELDQTLREQCIKAFNKAAVFLAKVMHKQEFQLLFYKLARRCPFHMQLRSACLTNIGMKVVLSCTCTPHICQRALNQAKETLTQANQIQSTAKDVSDAARAQCLSKLGFCCVCEGSVSKGFKYINNALKLRKDRAKEFQRSKDQVMMAACLDDLAASQMVQRNHMMAIQTWLLHVLPVYEENLGDHPFTATTLNWIGNSYHALGDYDNAIKYISKSVEMRRQLLGNHQETAKSLYDLGVTFTAKQEYETALKLLEEAADLQEEVLDTYEELIFTHQAMAVALRGLGRTEEAEEEMKRSNECAKKLDSWEAPSDMLGTKELQFVWDHF